MIIPDSLIVDPFKGPKHFTFGHTNKTVQLNAQETELINTNTQNFADQFEIDILEKDRVPLKNRRVSKIVSFTGDDQGIAGENVYVTATQISIPKLFVNSDIISRHDTLINHSLINYTEGYVLLCPHKDATFDSVLRKYQGEGMPLTFDGLKLKQFIPNTKGKFNTVDLSDKMDQAMGQTEWIHESWVGKPYAEMMKVMMLTLFDFRNARSFPFLYKTEGGCGGAPPFNNLETLDYAAHYYKGGRAREGITAIMSQSTSVQKGRLSPMKASALLASHLILTGVNPKNIQDFLNSKQFKESSREDQYAMLNDLQNKDEIPQELVDRSYTVEVTDKLIGAVISEYRKEGLIMTDLDVRTAIAGRMKFDALLGERNMGSVAKELELKSEKNRRIGLTNQLKKFDRVNPTHNNDVNITSAAYGYYRIRANRADITSLSYAGILRVYKTSDVQDYLQTDSFGLADQVVQNLPSYSNYNKKQKYGRTLQRHEYMLKKLNEGLRSVFDMPSPGIGPDDARIGIRARDLPEHEHLFVITDDAKLMDMLPNIHRNSYRIPLRAYHNAHEPRRKDPYKGIPVNKPYQRATSYYSDSNVDAVSEKTNKVWLMYDFANINRRHEAQHSDGHFFSAKVARDNNYGPISWDEFKNNPCFVKGNRRWR